MLSSGDLRLPAPVHRDRCSLGVLRLALVFSPVAGSPEHLDARMAATTEDVRERARRQPAAKLESVSEIGRVVESPVCSDVGEPLDTREPLGPELWQVHLER